MLRLFIDTSVFFSACYSQTGASAEIFRLALLGDVDLETSDDILEETRRNLRAKSPEDLTRFERFLALIDFTRAEPSTKVVWEAADYTEL